MDTSVSVSEMALVSAANSTSRKNRKPMMAAMPPMSANTVGNVMNMSEGPAFEATASPEPMATKAAETMSRPAMKDTPRSKKPMRVTDEVKLSCLRM